MPATGAITEKNGIHGVAVVSGGKSASEADQQVLLPVYLTNLRQRFKDEVNRMTSGGMYKLLEEHPQASQLSFPLTYLYAFHWLQHNVHENYREQLLKPFRGARHGFLMDLLLSDSAEQFISGYLAYWENNAQEGQKQWQEYVQLLSSREGDIEQLTRDLLDIWSELGLFTESYMAQFKAVAREERDRYAGMLGEEDRERLALVDDLVKDQKPVASRHFEKMGIIPAMGCPQTCRHCMFTWRPPRGKNEDPKLVFELVNRHTDSVLFTGGDLTKQLDYFYDAIRNMPNISNFAILLNGDFADTPEVAKDTLSKMASAIKSRPANWKQAKVLLQISFDEFHQEVYVDKYGLLAERIPVSKIANIVESYPEFSGQIQLALLHKQTGLNFSQDVLEKGVFARLAAELSRRGHQVQVMDMKASPRMKENPKDSNTKSRVLKDATFVLNKYPQSPILLTSSTIDGYGRAALLEEWETIKEKDLLDQVINHGPPEGESFDIDMMVWFNGWVTLFNAVHICLGDIYQDGIDAIIARQNFDPLCQALSRFDRSILKFYAEIRPDLDEKIVAATGPHHLYHSLTEEPEVRLHMTRRLLESKPST